MDPETETTPLPPIESDWVSELGRLAGEMLALDDQLYALDRQYTKGGYGTTFVNKTVNGKLINVQHVADAINGIRAIHSLLESGYYEHLLNARKLI